MATSGVAGRVYATQLIDLGTGKSVNVADLVNGGGAGGSVAWADITGKPAVIAAGADQAAARTAIGAGTSNLEIGTTATTAMAGNRAPTTTIRGGVLQQAAIADLTADPTQADINAILAALRSAGVLAS